MRTRRQNRVEQFFALRLPKVHQCVYASFGLDGKRVPAFLGELVL
ncbi:MAG: hypothetical protein KatS3mg111_1062 [Pirellulaceae bacterium]|nr:MAG: hypothetical protein KatS3mg111_1062 [Pirellulaceae bacterium]